MRGEPLAEGYDKGIFKKELEELGNMKFEEKVIILAFSMMAFLWFTRAEPCIGNNYNQGLE